MKTDTICAISTPPGQGGIAVIRVSGSEAFTVCDKFFKSVGGFPIRQGGRGASLAFGRIFRGDELLDEVMLSTFQEPHSYTGENVVEISCHGSLYIQQEILMLLLNGGCRLASAGEFTQRAFMNGKLDLSQAEAVGDLIASTSAAAHRVALQQLRGGISLELNVLSDKLLYFSSMVELELDFSEDDVEFADRKQLMELAQQIATEIRCLSASFEAGNAIKNGIPVAIVGETNVGKSTLLNRLLKEDRAIVSDIHGTTRDAIEDTVVINGVMFRFIDTAGIRQSDNEIEQIGVELSFKKIEQAAIVIWLIDLTNDVHETDMFAKQIFSRCNEKKLILILNKSDKLNDEEINKKTAFYKRYNTEYLIISAKTDATLHTLECKLTEMANIPQIGENDVIITNMRHYEALVNALSAIERVIEGLNDAITGDLLAQALRECLSYLNEITGKQISADDVLRNIFSKFCIGK